MDWQYIAGFFDGEGSLSKVEQRYRICITQANFEVLDQIRNFTGVGNIKPITKRRAHWQDAWIYYISDKHKVKKFLEHIVPHLVVKKRLVSVALPVLAAKIENDKKRSDLRAYRTRIVQQRHNQGIPYRAIGKELGIDWGYARRLIKQLK